jgi:hypothetical protein
MIVKEVVNIAGKMTGNFAIIEGGETTFFGVAGERGSGSGEGREE